MDKQKQEIYTEAMSFRVAADASLTTGDSSANDDTRTWTASENLNETPTQQNLELKLLSTINTRKNWSEFSSSIPGAGTGLPELEDAMNAGEDWDRRGNDEEK